jgi:hypothetical protein
MQSMDSYSKAAVERARKVQEVILRALSKKITWAQAVAILGVSSIDGNFRESASPICNNYCTLTLIVEEFIPPVPEIVTVKFCGPAGVLLPPPPQDIMNASVEIASAVSRTAATRLRRPASGTPASTAPKAISPPVHGNAGAWFAAEPDAVMVSVGVELLPPAPSVTVLFNNVAVINGEELVAVSVTVSANVVEISVTVIGGCVDPPGLSDTEVEPGVIVYAGAVTVSVCVPLEPA